MDELVGNDVFESVDRKDGLEDGTAVGVEVIFIIAVGNSDGGDERTVTGLSVGDNVGRAVGNLEGSQVGLGEGATVDIVGNDVGDDVGLTCEAVKVG
jgi:hypothetical protein